MQVQAANAVIQNLNQLNQTQLQIADKVQNFNNKVLKATVTSQVQASVQQSKAQSLNVLA